MTKNVKLDAAIKRAKKARYEHAWEYLTTEVRRALDDTEVLADEVERLQKLEGTDDDPEDRCDRCGGRNIESWYADSDVWNRVAGDFSILCPICFSELAADVGVAPTAWRLSIEGDDPEVSKLRVRLHERCQESADLHKEVERLRGVLRAVQWVVMIERPGAMAYPICVGCRIRMLGTLATPSHKAHCVIENALRPPKAKPTEGE